MTYIKLYNANIGSHEFEFEGFKEWCMLIVSECIFCFEFLGSCT